VDRLRALGCDVVQGHQTGRPLMSHEFASLLLAQPRRRTALRAARG
jgi:EAL domain-containing protein (putative c-di-GMP-specific phosphodiesterase class I)